MMTESKVVSLPKVKRPSKRIARVLDKWRKDHNEMKFKKVILVAVTYEGTVVVADVGFRQDEETTFRGMLDYVKDCWGWNEQ